MALSREKKSEILESLKEVSGAASAVFVSFKGLTVGKATEIRKKLREAGVKYVVAKKTLVKRAFAEKKIDGEMPNLEGEIAIAYGADDIAPSREVYNFQKQLQGIISICGGVFQGKFVNKNDMMEIATIPSQEILYGKFVNIINSPIAGIVMTLKAIADKKETN